jgi:hypothetical protein
MFTSRLTLCAMDKARDAGEICDLLLWALNEVESAVALSGCAETSLYVVEDSLEIRSPNLDFAVNNQRSQTSLPRNAYRRTST